MYVTLWHSLTHKQVVPGGAPGAEALSVGVGRGGWISGSGSLSLSVPLEFALQSSEEHLKPHVTVALCPCQK